MALVILLLFAFFVNEAQAKCSHSASLSVFLLQSNSPIEADEINNLTDIRNGLGHEEDWSCCLYYVEDNEGNDVNVTACRSEDIDTALDAINTTEYYHHVLVLGNEGTSLNYTLHEGWNTTGYSNDYERSMTVLGRGSPTIKFLEISVHRIYNISITNVSFVEGMITLTDIQNIQLTSVTICNSPSTGLLIKKEASNITISSCNFINNTNLNTISSQGGGLSINDNVDNIAIEDSQFTGNKAIIGGGLGIAVQHINNLTISGCSFTNNTAHRDGGGLWISSMYKDSFKFNVTQTHFTSNTASTNGGGAYIIIQNAYSSGQNMTGIFHNVQWISNIARLSSAMKLHTHGIGNLSAIISDNTFERNSSPKQYLSGSTTCSLYSDGFNIILTETEFYNNRAAGVCAQNAIISIPHNALFYNNTAYKGAGIYLDDDSYLKLGPHSCLNFTRNSAVYGAGIYQKSVTKSTPDATNVICFLNKTQDEDPFLFFQDNIATISGKAIFFNDPDPDNNQCESELNGLSIKYDNDDSKYQQIASSAINISFSGNIEDNETTLILGQRLVFNATITDIFDNNTFALVSIFLLPPDGNLFESIEYSLAHETTFTIETGPNRPNLHVRGPELSYSKQYLFKIARANEIYMYDDSQSGFEQIKVNVTLKPCPLGFRYHNQNEICECARESSINCDSVHATACIEKGYWHGQIKVNDSYSGFITKSCLSGKCRNIANCTDCSSRGLSNYCELPEEQNDQCIDNHEGVLCTECSQNYAYTFGAIQCADVRTCDEGESVSLVIIMIIFIITSMGLIFLLLKLDKSLNVGYMFSVLYYFSVLGYLLAPNNIPLPLEVMISVLVSITQLNPHFIGYIPVCLTKHSTILEQQMLFYVSPVIISGIVLSVVWFSKCCPRYLKFKDNTPVRAISLLLLLSFTAMAETSFNMINPLKFENIDQYYVNIQPKTRYLHHIDHVLWFCIGLLVELFLVLPFTFVLLFAPLLNRCFNLNKIKPFLDEFQDCYKDKYRWMAGYYFLCRQLYLAVSISTTIGASSLQYTYQILTLIVLTFHSIIMPYKSTWLNALDSFFLANLLLIALTYGLTATTIYQSSSISIQSAIIGILILFPVVYAVLGFLYALCLKIPQKHRDRMKLWIPFRQRKDTMSSVAGPFEQPLLRSISVSVNYREPALGLLDDHSTIRGRKKSKIVCGSTVVERPLTTSYNQEWQDNTPDENERRLSRRHTQIEDEDL